MPNWCENILNVSHTTPEFVEFMAAGLDNAKEMAQCDEF